MSKSIQKMIETVKAGDAKSSVRTFVNLSNKFNAAVDAAIRLRDKSSTLGKSDAAALRWIGQDWRGFCQFIGELGSLSGTVTGHAKSLLDASAATVGWDAHAGSPDADVTGQSLVNAAWSMPAQRIAAENKRGWKSVSINTAYGRASSAVHSATHQRRLLLVAYGEELPQLESVVTRKGEAGSRQGKGDKLQSNPVVQALQARIAELEAMLSHQRPSDAVDAAEAIVAEAHVSEAARSAAEKCLALVTGGLLPEDNAVPFIQQEASVDAQEAAQAYANAVA